MRFKALSDEQLIVAYLEAHKQKLDVAFLNILLDEILQRDIYNFLFETSSKT
jgi:hypothetical protein